MSTSVSKACFIQLVKKRRVIILFLKKVLVDRVSGEILARCFLQILAAHHHQAHFTKKKRSSFTSACDIAWKEQFSVLLRLLPVDAIKSGTSMNPTPESTFSSGCIRFPKKQSQITKIKKSQFSKRFSTKTLLHSEFGLSPVGKIIKNQASFQEEHSPKKLLIILLQEIKCPTSAIETPFHQRRSAIHRRIVGHLGFNLPMADLHWLAHSRALATKLYQQKYQLLVRSTQQFPGWHTQLTPCGTLE